MLDSDNPIWMDVLEGRFSTPAGNYFWHRKRQKVQELVRRYIQALPATEPLTWMDIGCGQGIDLFLIRELLQAHSPHWSLIGLEAEPTFLEICRMKRSALKAENVTLQAADITLGLPFADASVDLAYCSEVIEHLAEPELFLQEVRRVLKKPHGALILTTPNEPNVFQRTFWSKHRRAELAASMETLKEKARQVQVAGQNVFILDHVSLRTVSQWDATLQGQGFRLADYARGAAVYGTSPFYDQPGVLALLFALEAVLDALPQAWTRRLSDQVIALYQPVESA